MSQKKRIDHKPFRDLGQQIIKRRNSKNSSMTLNTSQIEIAAEHAEWFEEFIDDRRRGGVNAAGVSGRKRSPDGEVQPESIDRRTRRAASRKPK